MTTQTKKCPDCQDPLPMSEFYRNMARPDGRSQCCKRHTKIRVQEWKALNPEKLAAQRHRYVTRIKERNIANREGEPAPWI